MFLNIEHCPATVNFNGTTHPFSNRSSNSFFNSRKRSQKDHATAGYNGSSPDSRNLLQVLSSFTRLVEDPEPVTKSVPVVKQSRSE